MRKHIFVFPILFVSLFLKTMQIIQNLDFKDYLKIDRISASDLMKILKDPALYHYSKIFKQSDTSSMNFGRKLHLALLEEEKFSFLEIAKTATTMKEGFIGRMEYEYIKEIKRILKLNSVLNSAFSSDSKSEVSILWEHEDVKLKSKLDLIRLNNDAGFILDVKSTCCDNERDIYKSIKDYRYDIQCLTYVKALKSAYKDLKEVLFWFLFIQKQPPFRVFVVQMETDFDHEFQIAIESYKNLPTMEEISKSNVKFLTQGEGYAYHC